MTDPARAAADGESAPGGMEDQWTDVGGADAGEDCGFDAVVEMLSARFQNVSVQITVQAHGPPKSPSPETQRIPVKAPPCTRPSSLSSRVGTPTEAGWASQDHDSAAAAWENKHREVRGKRYYAVWKFPGHDEHVGVHAGVGASGYIGIIGLNGGFGGSLRFKKFGSMAEALRAYAKGAPHYEAPPAARFIPWP